jgi:hypothetical protein
MNDEQMNLTLNQALQSRPPLPHSESLAKPKCWLIGRSSEHHLSPAVARIARLRGIEVEFLELGAVPFRSIVAARKRLIALNFELLEALGPSGRQRLKKWAESGATIYIRGAIQQGLSYSLEPFISQQFVFSANPVDAYQFSSHWILPAAIARERAVTTMRMPQATGLDGSSVLPILSSRDERGQELPAIFALEVGSGVVIFDLNPEPAAGETTLLDELADPSTRPSSIGALAAVDWAAGRNPLEDAPINLVIDDRPVNYDYLSTSRLKAFLDHLETRYPGIHVDFAWTPNHSHPDRRYVDLLRRYNTGFVWHGFLQHVDHRTLTDFDHELQAGRLLVHEISGRYNVRFQPVMIFPFEKDTSQATDLLQKSDFIAKALSYDSARATPGCFRLRSLQDKNSFDHSLAVIYRHTVEQLSRDRMLALAVLGMPICALAHPRDLGLRRVERHNLAAISYFDRILEFAKEKSLRSMSLEDITAEVPLD